MASQNLPYSNVQPPVRGLFGIKAKIQAIEPERMGPESRVYHGPDKYLVSEPQFAGIEDAGGDFSLSYQCKDYGNCLHSLEYGRHSLDGHWPSFGPGARLTFPSAQLKCTILSMLPPWFMVSRPL